MHQEILESPKFSEIVFVSARIEGTIAPQGTSQVAVSGIMKLHGQDHEITLNFAVQPGTPGQEQATTRFSIPYVKWA
jgi:polyisoprenoid-binding protein YceI